MKNNRKNRRYNSNKKSNIFITILFLIIAIIILIFINKLIINKRKVVKTANVNTENTINVMGIEDENTSNNLTENETLDEKNSLQIENNSNTKNALKVQNSTTDNNKVKNLSDNNEKVLTNGLPVLMYHFFYDDVTYHKKDNNWIKISDFEEQVKYLSENNFYFPTWKEVENYIDGKTTLPLKSVVITVDDGDPSFFDLAVPILQKYNVTATSFVVTSWYGYRYDANMKNVVFESHSDNMHQAGANGKGRMVNWSYNEIVNDLKTSSQTLGNCDIFCYPFGHYNDTAIKALKDTNYKLAFTVEGGRVKPGLNKYKLPRVRVSDGNSMKYFINQVS